MKYLVICFVVLAAACQAQSTFFYLDFGPNDGTNGNATVSPDANGNHWNNPANSAVSAPPLQLVDASGTVGDAQLTVTAALSTNGINHGGLLAPSADLLGELAVATATQDYFFTNNSGSLTFGGLDPEKGYVFSAFASRNTPEVRESAYRFTGANEVMGSLQSSGPNLGGGGYNGNNASLYVSETVLPAADGTIELALTRAAGQFAYLNLLVIEELGSAAGVDVTGITVDGDDITVQGGTRRMQATVEPADATFRTVAWSVDDPTVAEITDGGELIPLRNGTVTVTATTLQPGVDVSGSRSVTISNQDIRHYFVDFGEADSPTNGPDANGNVWNNAANPNDTAPSLTLTTAGGTTPGPTLAVTKSATSASTGGLATPSFAAFGELAVPTATGDYFRTSNSGSVTFRNLDPEAAYQFRILGSAAHTGPRETTYILEGFNGSSGVVRTSGPGTSGPDTGQNLDRIFRSERVFPTDSGTLTLTYRVTLGQFGYLNALRLTELPGVELCPELDPRGIVVMGSSVARGQGAPGDMGYAFQYGELLEDRFAEGDGQNWDLTNISVGGNNTVDVTERWARDLAPLCDKYVVYGLSLANEGIRTRGQAAFDDFRDNMLALIERARNRGIQPVVVGNYARRDFNATDYGFIRQMNLLIHQWDVPSVNVLGTNDNGQGNWVTGYEADLGHPNQAGHTEFFHAFVPSLFDALAAGKPQPVRPAEPTSATVGAAVDPSPITFEPEETVHSFTISFRFATSGHNGTLLTYDSDGGQHRLVIRPDGALHLSGPTGTRMTTAIVNDGAPRTFTITHHYARGTTELYVDGARVGDPLPGRFVTSNYALFGAESPAQGQVGDLFYYRSGMNEDEIAALVDGALLKSSLELYVPFSETTTGGTTTFVADNLAQSTNQITNSRLTNTTAPAGADPYNVRCYPNPVGDQLHVVTTDGAPTGQLTLLNAAGRQLATYRNATTVRTADLPAGLYFLRVRRPSGRVVTFRIVR